MCLRFQTVCYRSLRNAATFGSAGGFPQPKASAWHHNHSALLVVLIFRHIHTIKHRHVYPMNTHVRSAGNSSSHWTSKDSHVGCPWWKLQIYAVRWLMNTTWTVINSTKAAPKSHHWYWSFLEMIIGNVSDPYPMFQPSSKHHINGSNPSFDA